ncbi:MAG: hypothetical protein GY930_09160 [bacterium]|nr:hypothetical protein [bacterium]
MIPLRLASLIALGLVLVPGAIAFQERYVTSPGMPDSPITESYAHGLELELGLAVDLRSRIHLGGFGRGGEIDAGLEAADVGARARFNRDLWGFVLVEGTEHDLTLRQAALVYEGLSGSSYLRLGYLPIDFGKQMQARPYELPYPERPGVLRAYLGDQVLGMGVSYGDVFATGKSSTLRASLGLFTNTKRLSSPVEGRPLALPELEVTDGPRIDELALNARITGLVDVGSNGLFQWGISAHSVPDFSVYLTADDGTRLSAGHLEQWVYGIDLTFGLDTESSHASWSTGWEGLLADGSIGARALGAGPATLEVVDDQAFGQYLWLERQTRSGRALGAVYSSFEQTLPGSPLETELSFYFSRPLGQGSTLRFQISHRDAEGEESSERILIQWIGLAGQLGHALDW